MLEETVIKSEPNRRLCEVLSDSCSKIPKKTVGDETRSEKRYAHKQALQTLWDTLEHL